MNSITKKANKARWNSKNEAYVKEYNRKYREEKAEQIKEQRKKYRLMNKEFIREYGKEYFRKHKEEFKLKRRISDVEKTRRKEERHARSLERKKANTAMYRERAKPKIAEWHRNKRIERKLEVIKGYGGCCACCGEKEYYFLAIDHVNGDGGIMRRNKAHPEGAIFYKWIIENNFPKEFQILCHNCNMAKGILGHCPHEDKKFRETT